MAPQPARSVLTPQSTTPTIVLVHGAFALDVAQFPAIFAADVDPGLAAVLAVSQRPPAAQAFADATPAATGRTKPSWGLVAGADRTINPDVERFGHQRAGMTTVEIDSSHLFMLAHPEEVAELVREAARRSAGPRPSRTPVAPLPARAP